MPVPNYGVLKARPVAGRRGTTHYHIRAVADGAPYRVAVNVRSAQAPSELLYSVARPFEHKLTHSLVGLRTGFTPVPCSPGGLALDFVRRPPFDRRSMRVLAADVPGPDNDLHDLLDGLIRRALRDPDALVYAIGSHWGPEARAPDRIFGFTPGNGIHNIHMNQGNHRQFATDDGVWQDGALLIQLATPALQWAAVFLAFQSQAWRTDDRHGHAMGDRPE